VQPTLSSVVCNVAASSMRTACGPSSSDQTAAIIIRACQEGKLAVSAGQHLQLASALDCHRRCSGVGRPHGRTALTQLLLT
jgi:hypothetical protein